MIRSQATAPPASALTPDQIRTTLAQGLAGWGKGERLLILIPDHTRTLPMGLLFGQLVELLAGARSLDFLVALGTHPPLSAGELESLVGITSEERAGRYRRVGLANHAWDDPQALAGLGFLERDEITALAGERWHPSLPERVEIRLNQAALQADRILIVGPVFPHEVVGFSGGSKYLFPGISGAEMIHATHWLGALSGVVATIGLPATPVRAMIQAAAGRLPTPVTHLALVMAGHDPVSLFIGEGDEPWQAAVAHSSQVNITWCERPFQQVLSCAPAMYDELWTAAKAMYKLEPAMAVGGELVLYAPHLDTVSRVHGKYIYEIGYHILPYFLQDWERFRHVPLGVLAHSTHLRGSGIMAGGVERPNVRLTLASRIPAEDCERLNLGYRDPASIRVEEWRGREAEGLLVVPRAGEMLYRVRPEPPAGSLPST